MAKITVRKTTNLAKVEEMLGGVPAPDLSWLVVLKDANALGLMATRQINKYEARVFCMLPQEHWGDKELIRGVSQGLEQLFSADGTIKLSMSFPETLPGALSLATRLGFLREGTNRASFRDEEGKVVDQLHLGRVWGG